MPEVVDVGPEAAAGISLGDAGSCAGVEDSREPALDTAAVRGVELEPGEVALATRYMERQDGLGD